MCLQVLLCDLSKTHLQIANQIPYVDLYGTKQMGLAFYFNPLFGSVAFSILLWLTPDDFTRQWETSLQVKG